MAHVLVTGASGFIGAALLETLASAGHTVRGAYRGVAPRANDASIGQLSGATDWTAALRDIESVVHLAGPAHARFNHAALQAGIVDTTAVLAAQAEAAGVRRFVYISSIKAACARTSGAPVSENREPQDLDGYGLAKRAAEQVVLAHSQLRPVVLRPPLVFAPCARANFGNLLQLVASGVPLPLAGLANTRSLISRVSLGKAIAAALGDDAPAGVFHVTDQPTLSTVELAAALCEGMGRPARMFHTPPWLLPRALTESLAVDDSRFRAAHGESWSRDVRSALIECARSFKQRRQ